MVSFNILDRIIHPRRRSQRHHKKSYSENDAALSIASTTNTPSSSSYSSSSRCTCRGSQYCNQCADMASPIIPSTAGFECERNPFDYAHTSYHSSASTSVSDFLSSSTSTAAAASAADRIHYQTSMLSPNTSTTNRRPRPKSTHFVEIGGSRYSRGLPYDGEDSASGVPLWAVRRQSELPQGHMARFDAQ